MLDFNEKGHLYPSKPILCSLEDIEQTFLYNDHRIMLWESYQEYTKQLTQIVGTDFYQWINGSFTTKKEYPQDIDLVNFLDYVIFEQKEKDLLHLKKSFLSKNKHIDSYFVKEYPFEHTNHIFTQMDKAEWEDLFGQTRRDTHTKKRFLKGFLEIHIKK